jgi:Flp pilus assembly protein TadD
MEQAIRLSPRDPQLGIWYNQIGHVHLLQSRIDEAIIWLERARNHTPAFSGIRAALAAAHALNGDTERAAKELAEARRRAPTIVIRASRACEQSEIGARRKSARYTRPLMSLAFDWPGCRRNDCCRNNR